MTKKQTNHRYNSRNSREKLKTSVIIVAAGAGKRFGGYKQFQNLCGKDVYLWSLETFLKLKSVREIILVVPKHFVKLLSKKLKTQKIVKVISGGKERVDSVRKAVKSLASDTEVVAIHDAARPLISKEIIEKAIVSAQKSGASIVAIPASDTIKFSDDGKFIKKTIPREKIFLAQTPQVFQRQLLQNVYAKAKIDKKATDDSYLIEKLGVKVRIVEGKKENLKITTKDDLKYLEFCLKAKNDIFL